MPASWFSTVICLCSATRLSLIRICMKDIVCTVCIRRINEASGYLNPSLVHFVCMTSTSRCYYVVCGLAPMFTLSLALALVRTCVRACVRVPRLYTYCHSFLIAALHTFWLQWCVRATTKLCWAISRRVTCNGMPFCPEHINTRTGMGACKRTCPNLRFVLVLSAIRRPVNYRTRILAEERGDKVKLWMTTTSIFTSSLPPLKIQYGCPNHQ